MAKPWGWWFGSGPHMGKTRAIEVNVAPAMAPTRRSPICVAISATSPRKFEPSVKLRLRSLELTQVNEQLRRINRELEELKNRYSDLYENAPAMYFSLDSRGR